MYTTSENVKTLRNAVVPLSTLLFTIPAWEVPYLDPACSSSHSKEWPTEPHANWSALDITSRKHLFYCALERPHLNCTVLFFKDEETLVMHKGWFNFTGKWTCTYIYKLIKIKSADLWDVLQKRRIMTGTNPEHSQAIICGLTYSTALASAWVAQKRLSSKRFVTNQKQLYFLYVHSARQIPHLTLITLTTVHCTKKYVTIWQLPHETSSLPIYIYIF